MAAELDLGPVDYFLVGFPPGAPLDGGALMQMAALVQQRAWKCLRQRATGDE